MGFSAICFVFFFVLFFFCFVFFFFHKYLLIRNISGKNEEIALQSFIRKTGKAMGAGGGGGGRAGVYLVTQDL